MNKPRRTSRKSKGKEDYFSLLSRRGRKLRLTIGITIILISALLALGLYYASISQGPPAPGVGSLGSAHEHASFVVYLNGKTLDFSLGKYQVRNAYVHVEDGNGRIIHKHATGIKIGTFFETLGMKFSKTCFALDTGEEFCNSGNKILKFYVNGVANSDFEKYEIMDKDRILITYGDESAEEIQRQIDSLSSS